MEQIAENLWGVDTEVKVAPGVFLPLRSTIASLSDGRLWLHSPAKFSAEDVDAINALGEVAYIVAPSTFHHLWFGNACELFPGAMKLGATGLVKKRPDLTFDGVLGECPEIDGVERVQIDGMPALNENVFMVNNSLICADLFQNLHHPKNTASALVFRLAGTLRQVGVSRLFMTAVKDKAAFKMSVNNVLELPFQRLIPCHGDVVENAKSQCKSAVERRL